MLKEEGRRKKENILDTQLLEEVRYLAKIANLKSVNSSRAAAQLERSILGQFRAISLNPASFPNQSGTLDH
jgi:hypothetical protein